MAFPLAPKLVKDAYDRTGLSPAQDIWIGDGRACGLAALASDRLGHEAPDSIKAVCALIGITWAQGVSFANGFDGDPPKLGSPSHNKPAYEAGRRSAAMLGL